MKFKDKTFVLNSLKWRNPDVPIYTPENVFVFYQLNTTPPVYDCERHLYAKPGFISRTQAITNNGQQFIVCSEGSDGKVIYTIHNLPGSAFPVALKV